MVVTSRLGMQRRLWGRVLAWPDPPPVHELFDEPRPGVWAWFGPHATGPGFYHRIAQLRDHGRVDTYCRRTLFWEGAVDVRDDEAGELDLVFPGFDRSPRCSRCEGASQNIEDDEWEQAHHPLPLPPSALPRTWGGPVSRWERRLRANRALHRAWIAELRNLGRTLPYCLAAADLAEANLAAALRHE